MATKKFDCVEMKHRAAAKIQARLAEMTREEQLEYWHEQTEKLLELQRSVTEGKKAS
jgi:hypothetical protein